MRTMTAKFDGRCRNCGAPIDAGDTIRYAKGAGAHCATEADCESYLDYQAEMAAEARHFQDAFTVRGFYDYVDDNGRTVLA